MDINAHGENDGYDVYNKENALRDRLENNLSDYIERIQNHDKHTLISMSEEIAARYAVESYLTNSHLFSQVEIDFLMQFQDPLDLVCDHIQPMSELLESSLSIEGLRYMESNLRKTYSLAGTDKEATHLETRQQALYDQLDMDLRLKMDELHGQLTSFGLTQEGLVEIAREITTYHEAHNYLKDYAILTIENVEYLLQFQNPLEVVADQWPTIADGLVDMSEILHDIFDKEDALQGGYSLAADVLKDEEKKKPSDPVR